MSKTNLIESAFEGKASKFQESVEEILDALAEEAIAAKVAEMYDISESEDEDMSDDDEDEYEDEDDDDE